MHPLNAGSEEGFDTDLFRRVPRLARLRPYLACPDCGGALDDLAGGLRCPACDIVYSIRGDRIYFVEPSTPDDALDTIKAKIKRRIGHLYYTVGVTIFAPTFPFDYRGEIRRRVDPKRQLVIDLGAGNHRIDEAIVTFDICNYDAVDVVCDLTHLPLCDNAIDAFVSRSVLEHVPDLAAVAANLRRCTRPAGLNLHLIPFLYPYHASPHDYQRLTHTGATHLFPGWDVVEQRPVTGPATLFLVLAIEMLSIILSAGLPSLRAKLNLLLCLLLFPIKFLDIFFVGRKSFLTLAPTILTVVRKP